MKVQPADSKIKLAVTDILSSFATNLNWHVPDKRFVKFHDEYQPHCLEVRDFQRKFSGSSDIGMKDDDQFLKLEPIQCEDILPIVTLQGSDQWVHFRIYVLLVSLDENSDLRILGLRFETDEGDYDTEAKRGKHDFCHMQFCQSLSKLIPCLDPSWLPESQPSIPLDADCQVSLVLCMLVSLYGRKEVKKRLSDAGHRGLCKYLCKVRALRPYEEPD